MYAPYSKLAKGSANAHDTITLNFLGAIPAVAMFKRVRIAHLLVALAIMAALTSTLLSIFTSGLYYTDSIAANVTLPLSQLDTFNFSIPDPAGDGGAGLMLSLIEYSNI